MSKLGVALRKKFKTPKEAIEALGLDESLLVVPRLALDGAKKMTPTRLEYLAVTGTARAINPLLMAMDAKKQPVTVDYAPLFKGLTTKNFKQRKPLIMDGIKKLIKGKTIAKDASVEHLAHLLDQFEHTTEPKSLDESVSKEQHGAMEAAAHGKSNLGIPKDVGEEFSRADMGKSFDKMIRDWAMSKDWAGGMSEDDFENIKKMHEDCRDEMPENALDESEEEKEKREREEREKKEAEDKKAADEAAERDKDQAKDKHAMDARLKGMVTTDQMDKALKSLAASMTKNAQDAAEAREFVRPFVGELPLALDSAEKILRNAAVALQIEDAETIHPSALKTIIKSCGRQTSEQRSFEPSLAQDGAAGRSTAERWPEASRIGNA